VRWLEDADERKMFISAISLGEIRKGTSELAPGAKRRDLEQWIEIVLRPWFAGRILPVTDIIAERWGELSAELRSKGRPIGMADGLIAATALVHELTVVTRNVKHFSGLGLQVINPWELP
jgi:predicted nucleic acid-binding protein